MAVIRISKGAQWRKEIKKAFDDFKKNEVNIAMSKKLSLYCENILLKAIRFRLEQSHSRGHDYTGNLINSIVVILYDDGEISGVFAAGREGQIRKPICRKMSARKKAYYYNNDWSNTKSSYRAELPTNRGVADEDVASFINSNTPSVENGFCITVAYTVEYAGWVEFERGTTGFLETEAFASRSVRKMFKMIKQVS